MDVFRKTIFLDIDGTLIPNMGQLDNQTELTECLAGVKQKLAQWYREDAVIILATGRRESQRHKTEKQLRNLGIAYDQLVMGCGRGPRIIINDMKPDGTEPMACAYSPVRNTGLKECPY